jgi:Ca2+-binding EF-hand superfamily protein
MADESNNGVAKGWTKLSSGRYLSVEEVTALMEAFKAKGNSKGEPLALKPFLKVVEEVNRTYHQPLFNHDEAQLTFHLLDTNHDGKGSQIYLFISNKYR